MPTCISLTTIASPLNFTVLIYYERLEWNKIDSKVKGTSCPTHFGLSHAFLSSQHVAEIHG